MVSVAVLTVSYCGALLSARCRLLQGYPPAQQPVTYTYEDLQMMQQPQRYPVVSAHVWCTHYCLCVLFCTLIYASVLPARGANAYVLQMSFLFFFCFFSVHQKICDNRSRERLNGFSWNLPNDRGGGCSLHRRTQMGARPPKFLGG